MTQSSINIDRLVGKSEKRVQIARAIELALPPIMELGAEKIEKARQRHRDSLDPRDFKQCDRELLRFSVGVVGEFRVTCLLDWEAGNVMHGFYFHGPNDSPTLLVPEELPREKVEQVHALLPELIAQVIELHPAAQEYFAAIQAA